MSMYPNQSIEPGHFRCRQCGYDLTGASIGARCPECGTSINDSLRASPTATGSASGRAITCMIFGILAIVVCGLLGIVSVAMYPGIKADVDAGVEPIASLTYAKVGNILGWISLALMGVGILFFIVMLAID